MRNERIERLRLVDVRTAVGRQIDQRALLDLPRRAIEPFEFDREALNVLSTSLEVRESAGG